MLALVNVSTNAFVPRLTIDVGKWFTTLEHTLPCLETENMNGTSAALQGRTLALRALIA